MVSRQIRLLTTDDIPAALQLCRQAGWNQLSADWHRLVAYQPDGCFAAVIDDRLVGTVTTTCYAAEVAWIGMMLVQQDFRRRGIATELMKTSLAYLRDQRVQCIKLDATPDGQHVYRQLGFQVEWSFQRWQRESRSVPQEERIAANLNPSNLRLDNRAFGADRSRWLGLLAGEASVDERAGGFGMIRDGYLASYLGPVSAVDEATAEKIIHALLRKSYAVRTFWDVMNPAAARIAKASGFEPVRDLTRMWIGSKLVSAEMELQYAICDPGTG